MRVWCVCFVCVCGVCASCAYVCWCVHAWAAVGVGLCVVRVRMRVLCVLWGINNTPVYAGLSLLPDLLVSFAIVAAII